MASGESLRLREIQPPDPVVLVVPEGQGDRPARQAAQRAAARAEKKRVRQERRRLIAEQVATPRPSRRALILAQREKEAGRVDSGPSPVSGGSG